MSEQLDYMLATIPSSTSSEELSHAQTAERSNARSACTEVAGMRAKVNITLTSRSSVYLVLHKPLLIYVGRVGRVPQVVSKCICY